MARGLNCYGVTVDDDRRARHTIPTHQRTGSACFSRRRATNFDLSAMTSQQPEKRSFEVIDLWLLRGAPTKMIMRDKP